MSSAMEEEVLIAEDELASLPKGWRWTTMEEVSEVVNGATPKTDDPANYEGGTIAWLTPADLSGYTEKFIDQGARFITKKGLESCSTHVLPKGTVLFTSRAPIGYVAIASGEVCTNQGFKSYVPDTKQVTSDYLYWWLKGAKQMAEAVASGTTFLELSTVKARKLPVPVAPLPEQRRIVSAIETQLGRLDAAVARLHAAKAKLKRYKQAVLKAAVEGRLTNPDVAEGELPIGWEHVVIRDIAELLNGDRGKNYPSSKHYVEEGVPFINTGHIEPNGQLSQERMNYIKRDRFNILNAGKIVRGDIVYCLRGATLGKTAIVDFDEGAIASSLMIIRLKKDVSREFIYYYLTSDLGRRNIADYDNGTAQPNLSAKSVGKYLVPLPPYDEQVRIVKHVAAQLSEIENMGAALDAQLLQSTRLRQAVLKRAFEGRLV